MRINPKFALAALLAGALACLCSAGTLSPPAGPVGSTMKTLSEVEPRIAINSTNTPGQGALFTINQPGSYYLAGNITNATSLSSITITTDDVTIDLGGFRISAASGTPTAISSSGARTVVRNGSIKGGYSGVVLATASRIESVNIDGCSSMGISTQDGCSVVNCSVRSCGSYGILIGTNCGAERCVVRSCVLAGIRTDSDCRLTSCTSSGNTGIGIQMDGVADGCIASGNTTKGFQVTGGSSLERCTAQYNTTAGFSLDGTSSATRCVSTNNNTNGFEIAGAYCSLFECSASANAVFAVRTYAEGTSIVGCTLAGVSGFPVIHHDMGHGVRIERNVLLRGTYGIDGGSQGSIMAVANDFYGQTSSAMGLPITYPHNIGTMYSSAGEVTTTNPWVNFYR
jgi:hypothetical protein